MRMGEWAKSLTDEQRAGLDECTASDERVDYCREHQIALPDELLDDIAGGDCTMAEICRGCANTGTCEEYRRGGTRKGDAWLCIDYEPR